MPTGRTYKDSAGEVLFEDTVVENHKGQWIQHFSTTATMAYGYDLLGRLTSVQDGAGNVCTSRVYTYDAHTNRTGIGSSTGAPGSGCPTATVTGAYTYDSADRLMTSPEGGAGAWLYDPFGRTTTMPAAAGTLKNAYYVNDLIASQTIAGQSQYSWTLDPLQRRSVNTQQNWNGTSWTTSAVKTSHYSSDSDEPTWVSDAGGVAFTRYLSGVEGDLALAVTDLGSMTLQLVDLHGDVAGTVPVSGATSSVADRVLMRTDEFGNPEPLAGASTANAPPRYGWLGAAQRSGETLGGLTLMGVRLYSSSTGRFLSVDPVAGGSANAYDYCSADPVNCTDLAGTFSFKSVLKVVAVVGEVASMIPGPVGAAAAGVSAVAYAAQGNKSKAIEMGITAAAALVGCGPVVKIGSKVAGVARAAGQAAVRAAPKAARAANETRVFWSGGPVAKAAATEFANVNGFRTLGMTPLGRAMELIPKKTPWCIQGPLWTRASARFARGAESEAHVFFAGKAPIRRSVWMRTERPILQGRGVRITAHRA